jgi:hypothetical protein
VISGVAPHLAVVEVLLPEGYRLRLLAESCRIVWPAPDLNGVTIELRLLESQGQQEEDAATRLALAVLRGDRSAALALAGRVLEEG